MKPAPFTRAAIVAAAVPKGRPCQIQDALRQLTPAERKEFDAAIQDFTLGLPAIQRALSERGFHINRTALHHHRHGRCGRCYGKPG